MGENGKGSGLEHEHEARTRPVRRDPLVVVVMVAVIAWAGYVVIKNVALPRSGLQVKDLGPMDLSWRVQQLGGQAMDMSSVKGKVVVLNFWEHWCPPCRAEIGSIQRLYEEVKGDDILVMAEFHDDPAATQQFLQEQGITMPVYQIMTPLPAQVAPSQIPTTYILNRDAHVVDVQVGGARWDDPSVVKFLKKLAAEKS
jgi:thiol-disulfide isomerase/thioredoxin